MTTLTPELLRAAADLLKPDHSDFGDGEEFMCHAVNAVFDGTLFEDHSSFVDLLKEHGVSTGGSLSCADVDGIWQASLYPNNTGIEGVGPTGYTRTLNRATGETQAVRFMFLEFLALDLETQEAA